MGLNLVEKILSNASGIKNPVPGDVVIADLSAVMISEALGPIFFHDEFETLGGRLFDPDKVVVI
jgi:homoaconitase/3-isopropylmalate dehydratase large subunit